MSQWNTEFKAITKVLKEKGYELNRIKGSHYIYTNGKRTFSIPKICNPMICKRLMKEIKAAEV